MRKVKILAVVFLWAGIVLAYAQQTTAPDQEEKGKSEQKSSAVTEEKEVQPVEGVVYNDGTMDYVAADVKFKIVAKDEGSGVKQIFVMVDDSQFGIYDNPIGFFTDGKHMIAYRVEDNVGNMSPIKYYEFIMDKNPPKVSISSDRKVVKIKDINYVGSNVNFGIYADDDYSGVKSIEYKIDDGAETTYDKPFAPIAQNGLHKVSYKATDNVGNVAQDQTYVFFMDLNAPTIEFSVDPEVYEKDGNSYISSSALIRLKASDAETAVANIVYSIDDGQPIDYQTPIKLKGGTHVIKARAYDLVGNASEEISATFVVDAVVPEAELTPVK